MTVRTTPATHDVLSPEALVLPAGAVPDPPEEVFVPLEDAELDESPAAEADDEDDSPPQGEEHVLGADPVRLYLRQMGQATLLTREGEVEIAKRIELGAHELTAMALTTPMGLQHVLGLGERIRAGEIRLRDLAKEDGDEDAEPAEDDSEQRARFLKQVAQIRRIVGEREKVLRSAGRRLGKHAARVARLDARLAAAVTALGLANRQVTLVVDELSRAAARLTRLDARLGKIGDERPRRPDALEHAEKEA